MTDDTFCDVARTILTTPERVVALSDADYQRWMFEGVTEASFFSQEPALVSVQPRCPYHPGCDDVSAGAKALALRRWELGVTPYGLVDAFGLSELVLDFVVREIVPRCPQCASSMERPRASRELSVPAQGYLLAVPDV